MSNFTISNSNIESVTCISNAFIDTYLPSANGSFVKVYLYLLRHSGDVSHTLSVSRMADALENTEADIIRALRYWNKEHVLQVEFQEEQVTSITFLPLGVTPSLSATQETADNAVKHAEERNAEESQTSSLSANTSSKVLQLPEKHTYSPMEAEILQRDSEVKTVLTLAETMMGEPLTNPHIQLILYLMSDLGFSSELVIYLYETSLAKGKKAPRYMEAIALNWAKKGIQTTAEAEEESSLFNTKYNIVAKTLGITRPLAPPERAIIDGWEKYCFSESIIVEACRRTIVQTGDQNLNYTGKILADWSKNGVRSLADIQKLDENFHKEKQTTKKQNPVSKNNQFQNFSQRTYSEQDFVSLEKQLLRK